MYHKHTIEGKTEVRRQPLALIISRTKENETEATRIEEASHPNLQIQERVELKVTVKSREREKKKIK